MELSVSDGTKEGTVLYSFAEPAPATADRPTAQLRGGFTDPQYWRGFGLLNVRREYQLARWDPNARGELELCIELPGEYRMAFDLDISGAPHLEFGFLPADRKQALFFRIGERYGAPQLAAFRGGASTGSVSAVIPSPGSRRVEFVRSERGLRMSVDGKPAFGEFRLPHGERLRISARCGRNASATLKNFRLDRL